MCGQESLANHMLPNGVFTIGSFWRRTSSEDREWDEDSTDDPRYNHVILPLDANRDIRGALEMVLKRDVFQLPFPLDPIANGNWKHRALTVGITLVC
jgi:hypothetical protein